MAYEPELVELHRRPRNIIVPRLLQLSTKPVDELYGLIAWLVGKACKTHEAIEILSSMGFGQDAGLLVRAQINLIINLLWIHKNPSDRVPMYLDYDWILRQQTGRISAQRPDLVEQDPATDDEINEQAQVAREEHGWGKRQGWSKKNIAEIAEEVGLKVHYDWVYRLLSNIEHSNPRSQVLYQVHTDSGPRVEIGPGPATVREGLFISCDLLLTASKLADGGLNLDISRELATTEDEFKGWWNSNRQSR